MSIHQEEAADLNEKILRVCHPSAFTDSRTRTDARLQTEIAAKPNAV